MLLQIQDGTLSVRGQTVLSHFNFEIKGKEKIAVVGRNGSGKTTLLRLLAGELSLDRDDKSMSSGIVASRKFTVGILRQQAFPDTSATVEEELLKACPCPDRWDRERFAWEQEYDRVLTGFGLSKEDKKKQLSRFSGGEQTKIALIRLLLEQPELLLLDEPTNHLDIETVEWLEKYLKSYPYAVVVVSHDRFFLDQTADTVYEIQSRTLTRYPGNYTAFREQKRKRLLLQEKNYRHQQEEIRRLEELIGRFKHKPKKAAFARSRRKILERMNKIEKPVEDDVHIFTKEIVPAAISSKWVFQAEHLKIGYEKKSLLELSLRIRRGQKIGIIGPNGAGKSTFLKTAAGLLPPVKGRCEWGLHVQIGYFDQQASGKVSHLSGGERARFALAELIQSRPNFFLLDEPTNHMDIPARETLESAFQAYTGTLLFVSHDRYFIRQVAESLLIFDEDSVLYYPFGYDHYMEHCQRNMAGENASARIRAEEQALISGLKNVPRAERHTLRDVPEEQAYADWQMRLVREPLERAKEVLERFSASCDILRRWEDAGYAEEVRRKEEELYQNYTECCLNWYERWAEFHTD